MIINKLRLHIYIYYFIFAFLFFSLLLFVYPQELHISIFLLFLLAVTIPTVFILRRRLDVFEPIYIFSVMYYLFIVGGLYYVNKNMTGGYMDDINYYNIIGLFNESIIFILLCFIMFMIGYFAIIADQNLIIAKIDYEIVGKPILIFFIVFFIAIGMANFLYVSFSLSGGPVQHIISIGIRRLQYEEKRISTLGHYFYYAAMYMWYYLILIRKRKNTLNNFLFGSFLTLSFLISFSDARLFATFAYILSFIALYYYTRSRESLNVKRIVIFAVAIIFLGIFGYFYRILSGQALTNVRSFLDFQFIWDHLGDFMIESGYIPHIPVVMKILEAWEQDFGYFYGETLFHWILPFIGKSHLQRDLTIPWLLKDTYYPTGGTGGHPPTVVGELYINFGYLGAAVAMMLLGALMAWGYNYAARKKDYWITVVYVTILMRFVFILPKTGFFNFDSPAYLYGPILFALLVVKYLTQALPMAPEKVNGKVSLQRNHF